MVGKPSFSDGVLVIVHAADLSRISDIWTTHSHVWSKWGPYQENMYFLIACGFMFVLICTGRAIVAWLGDGSVALIETVEMAFTSFKGCASLHDPVLGVLLELSKGLNQAWASHQFWAVFKRVATRRVKFTV